MPIQNSPLQGTWNTDKFFVDTPRFYRMKKLFRLETS